VGGRVGRRKELCTELWGGYGEKRDYSIQVLKGSLEITENINKIKPIGELTGHFVVPVVS
jgi:hypothetical protein